MDAVVPLTLLGLKPQPSKGYKIDFGILSAMAISGDGLRRYVSWCVERGRPRRRR